MNKYLSSPELLREYWEKYREAHHRDFPEVDRMTKRAFCHRMDFKDESLLAKWMKLDAPNHRRIPIEHVPAIAAGMRLSEREQDRLMTTRIREVREFAPGLAAAVKWAIDAGKRSERDRMKANILTDDEATVLAAYRLAKDDWPLGISDTSETVSGLVAHFQVQLERSAIPLAEEVVATQFNETLDPELEAKVEGFKKKLRLKSWVMASRRGASMYVKSRKEKA